MRAKSDESESGAGPRRPQMGRRLGRKMVEESSPSRKHPLSEAEKLIDHGSKGSASSDVEKVSESGLRKLLTQITEMSVTPLPDEAWRELVNIVRKQLRAENESLWGSARSMALGSHLKREDVAKLLSDDKDYYYKRPISGRKEKGYVPQPKTKIKIKLVDGLRGLKAFFGALAVPGEKRDSEEILAEVALVAAKAIAAGRPQWVERTNHEDLRQLRNAPLFMRKVYADLIDSDLRLDDGRQILHLMLPNGCPVWQEAVRSNDAMLVQIVQDYINKRTGRTNDLGDAEGLEFVRKVTRPAVRNPKPRGRKAAP